jgi:PleD family two-component response regulator
MEKRFKIFVADDDEDDQCIIKEAMSDINKDLVVFCHPSCKALISSLENCNHKTVCAIILDINMPEVNGLECLKVLKSSDKFRAIPVYILSSLRSVQSLEEFFDAGAANCFSKPISFDAYKELVAKIFNEIRRTTIPS